MFTPRRGPSCAEPGGAGASGRSGRSAKVLVGRFQQPHIIEPHAAAHRLRIAGLRQNSRSSSHAAFGRPAVVLVPVPGGFRRQRNHHLPPIRAAAMLQRRSLRTDTAASPVLVRHQQRRSSPRAPRGSTVRAPLCVSPQAVWAGRPNGRDGAAAATLRRHR